MRHSSRMIYTYLMNIQKKIFFYNSKFFFNPKKLLTNGCCAWYGHNCPCFINIYINYICIFDINAREILMALSNIPTNFEANKWEKDKVVD